MATKMKPLVVDIYHGEKVESFKAVYDSGIRGVIHKATQGTSFVDSDYAKRRKAATDAGLLWGAYHFATDADVGEQVEHFLEVAKPDDKTLLALDYEPNNRNTMSLQQAKDFLRLVYEKTSQRPVIYSGSLVKEALGAKVDPFLAAHRLWLCQYGPKAKLPASWKSYWLWQYTGDGQGMEPHEVPGISTIGIDLNVFGGKDLAAEWVHCPSKPAQDYVPERAEAKVADLKGKSRSVDAMALLQKAGIGTTAVSGAVGAANELVGQDSPLPGPNSVDSLSKAAEGIGYVQTITETMGTIAHSLSANGWLLGVAMGVGASLIATRLMGFKLEEFRFGRYHPSEE